jgi:hypothetical protein
MAKCAVVYTSFAMMRQMKQPFDRAVSCDSSANVATSAVAVCICMASFQGTPRFGWPFYFSRSQFQASNQKYREGKAAEDMVWL